MAQDDPFADIGVRRSEDPFVDIGRPQPSVAADIATQIPAGLLTGTEALATWPVQAGMLVGKVLPPEAKQYLQEPTSSPAPGVREALSSAENYLGRLYRRGLEKVFGGGFVEPTGEVPTDYRGIAATLPEPQTPAGRVA